MEQRLDRIAQRTTRRIADIGLGLIQAIAFVGRAARLIFNSFYLLIRGPSIGQPVRLRHVVQEIITRASIPSCRGFNGGDHWGDAVNSGDPFAAYFWG